jgi:hypothetical protein
MDIQAFIESMRALCTDQERLRKIGIGKVTPIDELVPPMLRLLDDLESGRLVPPTRAARPQQ